MAMLEVVLPAGARAVQPHVHHHTDEVWYILDGRLTLQVGAQPVEAGTGTCVIVPRGVVHTLHNGTEDEVRYLLLLTPGGMEGYFAELGALIAATPAGSLDPGQWAAIAAKYDTEFRELPRLAASAHSRVLRRFHHGGKGSPRWTDGATGHAPGAVSSAGRPVIPH